MFVGWLVVVWYVGWFVGWLVSHNFLEGRKVPCSYRSTCFFLFTNKFKRTGRSDTVLHMWRDGQCGLVREYAGYWDAAATRNTISIFSCCTRARVVWLSLSVLVRNQSMFILFRLERPPYKEGTAGNREKKSIRLGGRLWYSCDLLMWGWER